MFESKVKSPYYLKLNTRNLFDFPGSQTSFRASLEATFFSGDFYFLKKKWINFYLENENSVRN
jgi:hypothetical protein